MSVLASDFGPLDSTVAGATAALGAVGAILALWRPRGNWEPDTEELPRAPERVALVIATVAIVLLWSATRDGKHHEVAVIVLVASLGALIVSFLAYWFLLALLTLEEEHADDNHKDVQRKVIGGIWLTPAAKAGLQGSGMTRQYVFAGMAYDKDAMWSRASRTLARTSIILAYLVFVPAGTLALAACGTVIAGA